MELTEKAILSQLHQLPEQLKIEVLHYVSFLRGQRNQDKEVKKSSKRRFGSAQGKYKLSADFNAPLDDFKEYI
jgi:hypothetical protein